MVFSPFCPWVNVGEHQPHFTVEVDFINAQYFWGFKQIHILQLANKITDNLPDRAFCHPDLIGNTRECPVQCIILNVFHQLVGDPVVIIDVAAILGKCFTTAPALIAFAP